MIRRILTIAVIVALLGNIAVAQAVRPAAPDPAEKLRNHESVKAAVEAFFAAIEASDQQALERVFDVAGFTEGVAVPAAALDMEPAAFVDQFYSVKRGPDSLWNKYMHGLVIAPDMTGPFQHNGVAMYYWEMAGNGLVQYKATPKNGRPAYSIKLQLVIHEVDQVWKVDTYDDGKYRPWQAPQMYQVYFEGIRYVVPEDEYLANQNAYKAELRMPPPPWGGTMREFDMSEWAVPAWTAFTDANADRAAQIVSEQGLTDRGLSARLINRMATNNNPGPRNLEGRKQVAMAFTVLQAMYGTNHRVTHGMAMNIVRFRRRHIEAFGVGSVEGVSGTGDGSDQPLDEPAMADWAELAFEELDDGHPERAIRIVTDRGDWDAGLSARLINQMRAGNVRDAAAVEAHRQVVAAASVLRAMYRTGDDADFVVTAGQAYDGEMNAAVTARYHRLHTQLRDE